MDLSLDQPYADFRDELRAFLAQHGNTAPPGVTIRDRGAPSAELLAWQKTLIAHGYAARNIPKEYGGFGAPMDILENQIIGEEFSAANVSGGLAGIGIMMLVPTLLEAGTDEQKAYYIPKALTGEEWWCQGYSEPGSGSDLASLRTNAKLEGEEWVINGQKIWTSGAHFADMMFCLVRTEPDEPKHRGISYLLVPVLRLVRASRSRPENHDRAQRIQPSLLRQCPHSSHQYSRQTGRGLEDRQRHAEARARRSGRSE